MPAKPGNNPIFRITSTMYFFFHVAKQRQPNRKAHNLYFGLLSHANFSTEKSQTQFQCAIQSFEARLSPCRHAISLLDWSTRRLSRISKFKLGWRKLTQRKNWGKRMCSVDGLVDCVDCRVCGVWTVDE